MDSGPIPINGHNYRLGHLNAFEQLHVSRRIAPLFLSGETAVNLRAPGGDLTDLFSQVAPHLAETFARMTDADVEYVIQRCLRTCQRENEGGGWAPIMASSGQFMFADINMPVMMELTVKTIMDNLSDFFPTAPPASAAPGAATGS